MSQNPRIVTDNHTLFRCFHELRAGDAVACRLRLKPGEEHLLLDLVSRGIVLFPSATAQWCSRSKVMQARLLGDWMLPCTMAVYDRHDLGQALNVFAGRGPLVCKLDQGNAGQGILYFDHVEAVNTQAMLATLLYPFVLQPFVHLARDVRVVLIGDYVEAYERRNPRTFRHNLHCGGASLPFALSQEQLDFCHRVMERAGFPYAHVDLLIREDGAFFLSEINLRGGIRGAMITATEYQERVRELHGFFIAGLQARETEGAGVRQ